MMLSPKHLQGVLSLLCASSETLAGITSTAQKHEPSKIHTLQHQPHGFLSVQLCWCELRYVEGHTPPVANVTQPSRLTLLFFFSHGKVEAFVNMEFKAFPAQVQYQAELSHFRANATAMRFQKDDVCPQLYTDNCT